jgi:hypothetical protein
MGPRGHPISQHADKYGAFGFNAGVWRSGTELAPLMLRKAAPGAASGK